MKTILPILVAISALAVSGTAAYYSVTGLGALFAGATTEVIIMASALEFSKLIIASVLYRFWSELKTFLKVYLSIALFVLVVITSTGIYGFLSSAYQETSSKIGVVDEKISQIQTKKESINNRLSLLTTEKEQLVKSIGDLQLGLSNNQITYKDSEGNILTTTSTANRKAIEKQLDDLRKREQVLEEQTNKYLIDLDSASSEELSLKTELLESGEVGSLKYISNITGISLDIVVNYLILMLVVVFDPLALSLVTVFNMITTKKEYKKEEEIITKEEEIVDHIQEFPEELLEKPQPVKEVSPAIPDKLEPNDILLSDIKKVTRKSPSVTEVLLKSGESVRVLTPELNKLKDPKDETNVIKYL